LKIFPWHWANTINLFYNQYNKLSYQSRIIVFKMFNILVIVVLGGMGSITGSVVAAVLLAVLTTFLQSFTEIRMIVYSLLLVVIMLFRPQGLMGSKEITDLIKFRKKGEKIE